MKMLRSGFTSGCAIAAAFAIGGAAHAGGIISTGTYNLHNHPDGNATPPPYGFRLDELFNATGGHDVFTFDFDTAGANMRMDYDGSSIHIYGTAFGGLDIGGTYSGDPNMTSWVSIDFTYSLVSQVPGDNDIWAPDSQANNSGSITWLDTGQVIGLWDMPMGGYSFRFGDEDDDNGHRGFDGLSGWGWVNHGDPETHIAASDWLFTATLVPLPAAVWMGGLGLAAVVGLRRRAARSA